MRELDADFEALGLGLHAQAGRDRLARSGRSRRRDRHRVDIARWGTTSFVVDHQLHVGDRTVVSVLVTYVGVEAGTSVTAAPPARVRRAPRRAARPLVVTGAVLPRSFYGVPSTELAPLLLQQGARARRPARPGSSRSRPTGEPTTRPATPTGARPAATPPCSVRRVCCTSTSPTACTGAPTSCAVTRARAWPSCCGPVHRCPVSMRCGRPVPRPDGSGIWPTVRPSSARRSASTAAQDGVDLTVAGSEVVLVDDGVAPPRRPGRSPRIGISVAVDRPWRWYVPDDPHVSRSRTTTRP